MLNVDCSRWNIFELAVLVFQFGVVAWTGLFVFTVLEYSCHFGTVHFGNLEPLAQIFYGWPAVTGDEL